MCQKKCKVPIKYRPQAIKVKIIDDFSGGAESHYARINSRTGIKLFEDRERAEYARDRQRICSLHGIGPKVRSEVFKFYQNNRLVFWDSTRAVSYGYKTQVAKQFTPYTFDEHAKQVDRVLFKYRRLFNEEYVDDHDGNFGLIGGKVVIIDFGVESTCY